MLYKFNTGRLWLKCHRYFKNRNLAELKGFSWTHVKPHGLIIEYGIIESEGKPLQDQWQNCYKLFLNTKFKTLKIRFSVVERNLIGLTSLIRIRSSHLQINLCISTFPSGLQSGVWTVVLLPGSFELEPSVLNIRQERAEDNNRGRRRSEKHERWRELSVEMPNCLFAWFAP